MATQLLFIFMAVQSTGQSLHLDLFVCLCVKERAFQPCGRVKGFQLCKHVSTFFFSFKFEGVLEVDFSFKKIYVVYMYNNVDP